MFIFPLWPICCPLAPKELHGPFWETLIIIYCFNSIKKVFLLRILFLYDNKFLHAVKFSNIVNSCHQKLQCFIFYLKSWSLSLSTLVNKFLLLSIFKISYKEINVCALFSTWLYWILKENLKNLLRKSLIISMYFFVENWYFNT